MIPDSVQKVLNKLSRIDVNAAEYVRQRWLANTMRKEIRDKRDIVASFFSWADTPQHFDYWCDISNKYNHLPNITKLGNEL